MASPARARLGDLLVRAGIITPEQADAAAAVHRANGRTIGQQLLADGAVTELDLTAALSYQLDLPLIRVSTYPVDDVAVYLTPRDLAGAHRLLVVGSRDDTLLVAMADPGDTAVRQAIAERTGRTVVPLVAVASELERELERRGFAVVPRATRAAAAPAPTRVVPEARPQPEPTAPPAPQPTTTQPTVSARAPESARPAPGELVPFPRAGARPRAVEPEAPETVEPETGAAVEISQEPTAIRAAPREEAPEPYETETVQPQEPTPSRTVGFAPQRAEPGPEAQIVRFILGQAVREHAADVHIEPLSDRLRVRFRIEGALREVTQLPRDMTAAVASRVRSLAGMPAGAREGRLSVRDEGREATFEVTTVPTVWGDKIVLRVAERASAAPDLDDLGMESGTLERWRELLQSPYGLLLIAGMPGMGKTTTLYASVRELPTASKDVTMVEDAVSYTVEGVSQVQVDRPETYAATVRAVLAQEPDVLVVGELRDRDTSEAALNAALAGRVVLSTTSAPDSIAALYRLISLGADAYRVSAGVVAVLAQVLLPRLCEHCRRAEAPSMIDAALLRQAGLPAERVFGARGCARCNGTGHRGRVAAFELLMPTEELRGAIERGAKIEEAREIAVRGGIVALRAAALRLAAEGLTTVQDVSARLPIGA